MTTPLHRSHTRSLVGADPAHQAFLLLRTACVVAPIVFGLDKVTTPLADRPVHLAPWSDGIVLRDVGLLAGAVALTRLAATYAPGRSTEETQA
jgi:hypothetical protein